MNAPQPAHSPFGGSVATRVLRCPASVGLVCEGAGDLRKRVRLRRARHARCTLRWRLLIEGERSLDSLCRPDDQRLHDHARRRRKLASPGSTPT